MKKAVNDTFAGEGHASRVKNIKTKLSDNKISNQLDNRTKQAEKLKSCSEAWLCGLRWVTLPESFRTSIRGFSGSNHEDIFWNFPNWSTSNLRNWVSIYRQLQADCLYHSNCLYNFPAYTWRQKRNAFPGLCNGSILMIQKNLIIISGTEPRILCSEVIRKNNSSMTHLNLHILSSFIF